MPDKVLNSAEQITPEWLTDVLFRHGYLTQGQVIAIHQSNSFKTLVSAITQLEVQYSNDAETSASTHLLIKMAHPDLSEAHKDVGKREVEFYQAVLNNNINNLPVPHCYDATYEQETGKFHLLLDDLTSTHYVLRDWPVPPTIPQCEMVIDSLARLHAHWWGIKHFGQEIEPQWQSEAEAEKNVQKALQKFAAFADYMGDNLSEHRKRFYEYALAKVPALYVQRFKERKHLTLVHGDTHLWNYMYPLNPEQDQVLMIDWQSAGISLAAGDLAYMITVHWYPERRARLELPLLKRYYQHLLKHGVKDYSWDDFWNDYRLDFAGMIYNAIWQWSVHLPAHLWWNHFERNALAFEDLHCMELLQ